MAANYNYKDHATPLSMRFTHYLAPSPRDSSPTPIRLKSILYRAWLSIVDFRAAGAAALRLQHRTAECGALLQLTDKHGLAHRMSVVHRRADHHCLHPVQLKHVPVRPAAG